MNKENQLLTCRSNWLKFKTSGKLPIILEESMDYTLINEEKNRKKPTCSRLDMETLGSRPNMPKNLPWYLLWSLSDVFIGIWFFYQTCACAEMLKVSTRGAFTKCKGGFTSISRQPIRPPSLRRILSASDFSIACMTSTCVHKLLVDWFKNFLHTCCNFLPLHGPGHPRENLHAYRIYKTVGTQIGHKIR